MPVMNMFPGGSTLQIPLDAPTALAAKAGNAKVELTWTDPKDKYATPEGEQAQDPQQLVSVWAYTKIVRKAGSAPAGPNDGVAVVSSQVRNAYQAQPFVDTGVVNDTTYYYAAFAYNEDFVVSEGDFSEGVTPKAYDPVLANNTWEQIDAVCTEGIAPSVWEIGDEKDTTVLGEVITTVILDFNHDDLADGSGKKAVISFGSKNLMESTKTAQYGGKAMSMGEDKLYLRWRWGLDTFYASDLYYGLEENLIPFVKTVTKKSAKQRFQATYSQYSTSYDSNSAPVWMFSPTEVYGEEPNAGTYFSEKAGLQYPYYSTSANRIKRLSNGKGSVNTWTLRGLRVQVLSGYYDTTQYLVSTSGGMDTSSASDRMNQSYKYDARNYDVVICFGFCVGKAAA